MPLQLIIGVLKLSKSGRLTIFSCHSFRTILEIQLFHLFLWRNQYSERALPGHLLRQASIYADVINVDKIDYC